MTASETTVCAYRNDAVFTQEHGWHKSIESIEKEALKRFKTDVDKLTERNDK